MTVQEVRAALRQAASPEKAAILARFFKTGPGEYGEGDHFLGVVVPAQRKIVRDYFAGRKCPDCGEVLAVVRELLHGECHEERLTGLLILVELYRRSGGGDRSRVCGFYLEHLDRVNNWDLVDLSAPGILGAHLLDGDPAVLFRLAESGNVWERRVAVLATLAFIRAGRFSETLRLAERLLLEKRDTHDLMHKAVGWMLREVGKRDRGALEAFLEKHAAHLPRTALRYAIERFSEAERRGYLAAGR